MFELYLGLGSALGLVASVLAARILLVRMPADYFYNSEPLPGEFRSRYPVVRWSVRIAKNLLGVLLTICGIVMLLTPGPGLLAIVLGISLLDLPKKRDLQRRIVGLPPVLRTINRARLRRGLEPLIMPAERISSASTLEVLHRAGDRRTL